MTHLIFFCSTALKFMHQIVAQLSKLARPIQMEKLLLVGTIAVNFKSSNQVNNRVEYCNRKSCQIFVEFVYILY